MSAITRPALRHSLTEVPRATGETLQLMLQLPALIRQAPRGHGQPVLTLPGYGASDGSMKLMRLFLQAIGYRPFSLQLGRNIESRAERIRSVDDATAFRKRMAGNVARRIVELQQQTGEKITLVGWSMGGCYALDASQQQPDKVAAVITLGSPFGDPRGTATWDILRWLSRSTVAEADMDFAGWLDRSRLDADFPVPVHVIYSERDGIVSREVARLPDHPAVQHRQVDSSHMAFAFNPRAYAALAQLLQQAGSADQNGTSSSANEPSNGDGGGISS
ncbi:MAG TPA: alpha/beta hydrolase [Pseudomonadales bacterium]